MSDAASHIASRLNTEANAMTWASLTHEQRLDVARRAQDAWYRETSKAAPHRLGHAALAWSDLDADGQARVVQDVERALTEPARYCRQWLACVRQAMSLHEQKPAFP